MITREKKKNNIIEIKEKEQKQNECLILPYPMVYYANTIQPILTYTNVANRIQYYKMKKKKNNYPMHVPRSRGVRCSRRCHMGALPLSEKVK